MKKIAIVSLLFMSACKFNIERTNNEKDKARGEQVVSNFYSALEKKQISDAMHLMHTFLLASNDTAKLRQFLVTTSEQLQTLKERKLDHWQCKVTEGLNASDVCFLYYVNKYENYELKVSIALRNDDNNNLRIISLNADPNKFTTFN